MSKIEFIKDSGNLQVVVGGCDYGELIFNPQNDKWELWLSNHDKMISYFKDLNKTIKKIKLTINGAG